MNGVDELVGERSNRKERLDCKFLEHSVSLTFSSAHQHNHLVTQFEAVGLELDASWTYVKQESKVCGILRSG